VRGLSLGGAQLPLALAASGLIVLVGSTAAAFRSPSESAGNLVTAAPDFRAPIVTAAAIGKAQGGTTGFVRSGGAYFVYANVSDGGNPPSGVAAVSADLSSLTPGETAVPLNPGSYSAGGQSYDYRSAQRTAAAGLPEGPVGFTTTSVDAAANSAAAEWTAVVDNTPPAAIDVQATNSSGGTAGKAEQGDTVAFSFDEPVDPESILPGWSGGPTPVVVRITTGIILLGGLLGEGEGLQVYDAANSGALPLGAVDLKRQYVAKTLLLLTGTMTFGAPGAPSTMSLSNGVVTIVLGAHGGNDALTVATPGTMLWEPGTTSYDRAANPVTGAAAEESAPADVEF
jgi:hypothetical protein